ncbi:hypothetical protein [Bacillus sp. FJAT-27986]|uniref:hypothetical protein n=1 Tax=Bacillus sp. FJAT-27986 TaxID=1743146 RepID=UPI00080AD81A|nr:hypothetical protein [Bacillus sp. FJAT-27986]OCA86157.1 hypothetical protein A8L44_07000 [Bacillus sp. FJAT-27986]
MNDMSINFPDEVIDRFNIEGLITSPYKQTMGWVFLSENKGDNIILRIFLIDRVCESISFELNRELSAFIFPTRIEMKKFYEHLLNMSALEYMVLLNDDNSVNFH